jgi:glycosyltransferase involved in cell wall biosynthesis
LRVVITADPEIPVPPITYGGIERIIEMLVGALRVRGHKVGLVAHPTSTCQADSFYSWSGLQSQQKLDSMLNMQVLRKVVSEFRPDVLHSFSRILYMLPYMRSTLPKLMTFEREPTQRTVRLAVCLTNGSLSFTGCSEYICRQGRKAGGVWYPVHNCVDTTFYQWHPKVANDAPLVFLSRVERIKGAHTAIKIAKRTGRRLIIAGNHASSGPELEYWTREIAPQLGYGIEYVGPVNDHQKNVLLGSAAAMIVPVEWNEPFGIVFAEALACGTPVISCPRGALPEIVRSGIDGFLIRSVEEGCEAVARVQSIERSACRKRAEDCFSVGVISKQYEQIYNEQVAKVQ